MKYFELYKNEDTIFLKSYFKEYDNSVKREICWKKYNGEKFVACEGKDFSKEPEIYCRVRVPFERPYADTEIIIDIEADKKFEKNKIVEFIQKCVDGVQCKHWNDPTLNWYSDRYTIEEGRKNEGKFVNWTYTRTIPFLD